MKRLARGLLRRFGVEVSRIQDPSRYWQGELPDRVRADLRAATEAVEAHDDPDNNWTRGKNFASYVTPRRTALKWLVLSRARELGVTFAGKDILDVGSGTGYLLRMIQLDEQSRSLTGYDISETATEVARLLCPDAEFTVGDFFRSPSPTDYDIVLNMEVLEHLDHPDRALRTLYDATRAGGCVIATVPDGRHDHVRAGQRYVESGAYWGHVNFWSPESWKVFVEGVCPEASVHTEKLASGHNFAFVQKPSA